MFLKELSKYKISKELLSEINGSGHGTVQCEDGTQFSAAAESMESVYRGDRWCRDHGHGGAVAYIFQG